MSKQQAPTLFELPPRVPQQRAARRTRCIACGELHQTRCAVCHQAMEINCGQMTATLCIICWEFEPGTGEAILDPEALYRGIGPKQVPA